MRITLASVFLMVPVLLLKPKLTGENHANPPGPGTTGITVSIKKTGSKAYCLYSANSKGILSEWKLSYPVYHFECADMDNDGTGDILVGVEKKTRFDSVCRKRIFMFKLVKGCIRPLWLGSRVSQPLVDFKVVKADNKNLVRTLEQEMNGRYLVADYQWGSFGLKFMKYVIRNADKEKATKLLIK